MTHLPRPARLGRRTVTGALAAGVSLPVLAACSGGGGSEVATDPTTPGSGSKFARTSDIEVGGGKIYADERVVITQPSQGQFKCFTAVCTHQGCIVSSVADGTIDCACHGSAFSIDDGSVVNGPATQPLAAEQITVQGDAITLG